MFAEGTQIGKYEIRRQLGRGGFGMVYLARDVGLGRDCALKFLLPEHTTNPELLQRFLLEARSAAKIDHAGIVTVFECGQIAGTGTAADGTAFIAMEMLKGESLSNRLARDGALPVEVAVGIARQIASALHAAHSIDIVHRDLKPDNVFLVPDPEAAIGIRVKVLDFGIAKLAEAKASGVHTASLMIFGTPLYMSPEQCRSSTNVDARSDIYALGVMLFEMLCGERPFEGEPGALIAYHQVVAPPTLRSKRAALPETLENLVGAMLAKRPEDRPATMESVVDRLQPFRVSAEHSSVKSDAAFALAATAQMPSVTPQPLLASKQGVPAVAASTVNTARSQRTKWLLLGGASLLAVPVIVMLASSGPTTDRGEPVAKDSLGDERDALWKLAPDGARGGIVLTADAVGMLQAGARAVRDFSVKAGPELRDVDQGLAKLVSLQTLFGKSATDELLASFGASPKHGGALFRVADGWVVVLPIDDRDTFIQKAKGTKAVAPGGVDRVENAVCKPIEQHYVCAGSEGILASVGKGTLAGRITKVGARGDLEGIWLDMPLAGGKATAIAVAKLERGTITVRGLLVEPSASLLANVGPAVHPRTLPGQTTGLAVLDIRPMLASSSQPLVDGETVGDFAKTIAGPLTIVVPGGRTMDIEVPLTDPGLATRVLARCSKVPLLAELGAKMLDGSCHITAQQLQLDLDLWVDGNMLHLGVKKPGNGRPVQSSEFSQELANREWNFAFWGRGTVYGASGVQPSSIPPGELPADQATVLRITALLAELGFGAHLEASPDGNALRFVAFARTAFSNSDPILAELAGISARDVMTNQASAKAQLIADRNPTSPFAQDFAAGQLGMLIPTMMISSLANSIIPQLLGSRPTDQPTVAPGSQTQMIVDGYAKSVYPLWLKSHSDKPCPTIDELAASVDSEAIKVDEWGHPLVVLCGKDLPAGATGIGVMSFGPDGQPNTHDDIRTY